MAPDAHVEMFPGSVVNDEGDIRWRTKTPTAADSAVARQRHVRPGPEASGPQAAPLAACQDRRLAPLTPDQDAPVSARTAAGQA
jgi:hypothetical protein